MRNRIINICLFRWSKNFFWLALFLFLSFFFLYLMRFSESLFREVDELKRNNFDITNGTHEKKS